MNKVLSRILILQNKENSLTKLPFKKQPKTKVDKKEYEQAERAAVLIRRMQYSKIIKDQQKVKLQSAEDLYNMLLFEAKLVTCLQTVENTLCFNAANMCRNWNL